MFPASFNLAQPKQTSRTEHFARPARRSFFVSSHVGLNVGSGGESGHYESRQRGRIDGYRALPL